MELQYRLFQDRLQFVACFHPVDRRTKGLLLEIFEVNDFFQDAFEIFAVPKTVKQWIIEVTPGIVDFVNQGTIK